MKCEKCKSTGHFAEIHGFDFTGFTATVTHCKECKGTGEVSAQQNVQPTGVVAENSDLISVDRTSG